MRVPPTPAVWALYVSLNGFLSIALLAIVAAATRVPFILPSLGPTAYLLFFTPRAEASSPHNTLIGHAIGLACGYGAFLIMGTPAVVPAHGGFDWPRVFAAALSLGATGALMVLAKASHPPAGAPRHDRGGGAADDRAASTGSRAFGTRSGSGRRVNESPGSRTEGMPIMMRAL